MTKLSEFMHHPWLLWVRARLAGTAAGPSTEQVSTVDAARREPDDAAGFESDARASRVDVAPQALIVAQVDAESDADTRIVASETQADAAEAEVEWEIKPPKPNRLRPRTAQFGFLGLAALTIWFTWPRNGAPDYTLAAQWKSRETTIDMAGLAVVNPANAGRATPVAGNGIISTLAGAATPTLDFPVIIVVTPTAAGQALIPAEAEVVNDLPRIVLESSEFVTTTAPSLIELELPGGTEPLVAAISRELPTAEPILVALPSPTPTEEPQAIALANIPRVEVVPALGATPTPTPEPATPAPTPTPTATPPSVGPGRLWSTFTPKPPAESDHFWVGNPFEGFASNRFASPNYQFGSTAGNRYRPHHGVDISNPMGTPVRSGVEGVVVHAGPDDLDVLGPYPDFYGRAVVILLDRKLPAAGGELDVYVLYGHLSEVRVEVGQRVLAEDIVGLVGMTGIAIGPHLHVEIRLGGNTYSHSVNPYLWMEPPAGHGAVAVRVLTADGRTWAGAKVSIARFEGGQAVWARQIETYLDTENIGPDPAWGENGAMGDVPAGLYYLIANIDGDSIRAEFTVRPGETSFVEIRTGR